MPFFEVKVWYYNDMRYICECVLDSWHIDVIVLAQNSKNNVGTDTHLSYI